MPNRNFMNRRTFLQNTAITASGISLLPGFLTAKEKSEIILGHNNKRYRIDTKWGQLDFARFPVKDCHEMVQDSKGRIILLTNETKNNVIIYDKKGKLLTTWGNEYPGGHGLTLFNENGQEVLFIYIIWLAAAGIRNHFIIFIKYGYKS